MSAPAMFELKPRPDLIRTYICFTTNCLFETLKPCIAVCQNIGFEKWFPLVCSAGMQPPRDVDLWSACNYIKHNTRETSKMDNTIVSFQRLVSLLFNLS